jgi:predicted deacylase
MATGHARLEVDLDARGRQFGVLAVDYSDDANAFATIPVPVAVLAGGPGPTVLLAAGTHGDEWEGQLLVRRLIRTLEPARLRGRIIALPALNLPAVRAARRTSPVDGANLNRAFPGDPDAGPTAIIAHVVEHHLLALADYAIDLHSGGSETRYLPCAFLRIDDDARRTEAKLAAAEAFGLPDTMVVPAGGESRTMSAAADRQNAVMLAAELAGAGTVDGSVLADADAALHRLLAHWGLIDPLPERAATGRPTRFLRPAGLVTSPVEGILEPVARLGDRVGVGQLTGLVHRIDELGAPPAELRARQDGVVAIARVRPRVRAGSHAYALFSPVDRGQPGPAPAATDPVTAQLATTGGQPG